jgi:transcriptional regulator with XRE-family HTH domain
MMEGMTLHDLFKEYGIYRPSDLAEAATIDRRHAWMIWHGKRGIGTKLALRLFERKKIPLEKLLRAKAEPQLTSPRGRPRKRRDLTDGLNGRAEV